MGEVVAEDRGAVPRPEEDPSEDFLPQLADYTARFRMWGAGGENKAYKSF